ncbi:Lipopolysaccharide biosynthesis protein, LPS:glycosyltransferase [Terribacillus halophilus]|uniref:Lipopolysaccharide biosynthesis protein, LPS:glycosyltransferase n=1 Tax=Terribacillus halophilus TaxID=361279 RepID=A0A1G6RK60_9BACI|nr:glycosyltransferase family 8 protein [Terribacillus halophilus]SDD04326.1 Lipopolysaccharide biosynthesis protein, LPS:glycosyltransferase [Terribacillus halophilus]
MHHKDTIHVVSSADDNYAHHLGVMLASLLTNVNRNRRIMLYVIDGGITKPNKRMLMKTTMQFGVPIRFLTIDTESYKNATESRYINKTAYYRISIPEVITDPNVERVIYIDCDTLVLTDISELHDMDFDRKLMAAVEDAGQLQRLEKMDITTEGKYFNSGMMVIDMEGWRKQNISKKVLQFIDENNDPDFLYLHDQDALNAILWDKWKPIHPRWNAQSFIILKTKTPTELAERKRYKEARQSPAIVHFTGANKPWNSDVGHPFAPLYFDFLQQTPWKVLPGQKEQEVYAD